MRCISSREAVPATNSDHAILITLEEILKKRGGIRGKQKSHWPKPCTCTFDCPAPVLIDIAIMDALKTVKSRKAARRASQQSRAPGDLCSPPVQSTHLRVAEHRAEQHHEGAQDVGEEEVDGRPQPQRQERVQVTLPCPPSHAIRVGWEAAVAGEWQNST